MMDKAIFNRFVSMRCQNVPLSAAMIQEKALKFDNGLNAKKFQASDGWLRRWKEGKPHTFQDCINGIEICYTRNGWWEMSLPTLLMNLQYSMNVFQIKPINFFLPLNTTSKAQPMHQGVICSLKTQYRKNFVSKIIQSTEKKKTPKNFFSTMNANVSWSLGCSNDETVANCFRKSKILSEWKLESRHSWGWWSF